MHWLEVMLGLRDASGPWYLWWSGFFPDVTVFVGVVAIYRKVNCHTKGCWRLALHRVDGTPFVTCRLHHPTIGEKPTAEHIRVRHHATRGR